MCKRIVEYRWGTGWELILKVMDGMIKFVEVPWECNTEISVAKGCNMIEREALVFVSLHHPTVTNAWRLARLFSISACQFTHTCRQWLQWLQQGLWKRRQRCQGLRKILQTNFKLFSRSCGCFNDVSILNDHDIVGERGGRKEQTYIQSTCYPLWPFSHVIETLILGWHVLPRKRRSTKSHATNQSQFCHAAYRVWFEACLHQMPYLWPNGTLQLQLVGKVTSWAPSVFHHHGFWIAVFVASGWVGQRWGCFGTANHSSSFRLSAKDNDDNTLYVGGLPSATCQKLSPSLSESINKLFTLSCFITCFIAISVAILCFLAV